MSNKQIVILRNVTKKSLQNLGYTPALRQLTALWMVGLLIVGLLAAGCGAVQPIPTATPVTTPTPLPTVTPMPAPTHTPTPLPTVTPMPTPTHTPTAQSTNTATPSGAAATGLQRVTFSGAVKRGDRFQHEFTEGLTIELFPTDWGWFLAVRDAALPGEDLARLTPPFHAVPNPREIEGWHFRNLENTGPNEGSVNAPQQVRNFIFSPKVGRSIQYPPTAEQVAVVEADGRGTLTITDLQLGNLKSGERAHIETMAFDVTLEFKAE